MKLSREHAQPVSNFSFGRVGEKQLVPIPSKADTDHREGFVGILLQERNQGSSVSVKFGIISNSLESTSICMQEITCAHFPCFYSLDSWQASHDGCITNLGF